VAANHTQKPIVYLAKPNKDKVLIEVASQKWLDEYDRKHKAAI
jgi:hypothetical protein